MNNRLARIVPLKRMMTIPTCRVMLAGLWLLAGLHAAVPAAAGGRPPPAGILDKALAAIPETERHDSYRKWVPIRDEQGFDYAPFWMVLAGFAVILLALVVWNRWLAREITRRKGTEEMLLRVNKAVECASDAIGMADSQGRHFYQNKAFTDLFEYQTEEINAPGGEPAGYVDKNLAREVFATIMSGGSWNGEVEVKSKSGRQFPVRLRADAIKDEDGRVIGLVGVHTDITERKQAEHTLRASEKFLDTIFEQSPHSMWVSDDQGTLLRMNQACRRLLHATDEDLVGKYNVLADNIVAEQGAMPLVKRVFEHGEQAHFTLRYDSSRLRPLPLRETARVVLEVTISPVLDARRRVTNTIVQHVDITDREQAEQALRASLEEKVILLKEVHHRVKNNLQIISSLLNLQARKVRSPEFQAFLQDTQNRIRAMALLHETLYGSGNLACVSFRGYVDSVCIHLARSYASDLKKIRIQQDIAEVTLPLDQAIPAGLIINELLSNAFKHAFAGRSEGKITVQLRSDDELLHTLRVADNGVGLPAADTRDSGTLGLRLVASLVQQLEGQLSVERGAETVFQIAFPKQPR